MRIGLISDTHGKLRPQVFDKFTDVELILHAGDVGDVGILIELQAVAPVHAVWGNTDDMALRRHVAEVVELEREGTHIVVTHGDQLGSPTAPALRAAFPHAGIIVYGHTHVARVDDVDGVLVVNPGAAGPARFRLAPSVALLTLTAGAREVEILPL